MFQGCYISLYWHRKAWKKNLQSPTFLSRVFNTQLPPYSLTSSMRIKDPSIGPCKVVGNLGYLPASSPISEWFNGHNMVPSVVWCLRDALTNPRADLFCSMLWKRRPADRFWFFCELITWPIMSHLGLPCWLSSKESASNASNLGWIPGSGRSPEEEMATHSSILAWRIPWPEKPGDL